MSARSLASVVASSSLLCVLLLGTGTDSPAQATAKTKPEAKAKLDINKATADELATLPGIGPVHAKDIIANRPYKSIDDLERVKGLNKLRIDAIRNLVTVTPAAKPAAKGKTAATLPPGRKVNINTASKAELDVLPGIGAAKAQAIIDGRPFKTIEDIKKVKGIKDGEFSKIKDMITVD